MSARADDTTTIKIELEAGNASIPELGKMLGPHGVPIAAVKWDYDQQTAAQRGHTVPAVITVHSDRSWSLRIRTPTTASLVRNALNGGAALSQAQLRAIAQRKLDDLNTDDIAAAMRTVAGTARSMGVSVSDG